MNKQKFIAGTAFNYDGHFQTLKRHPLKYDAGLESLVDQTDKSAWPVKVINEDMIILFKPEHGMIWISFDECFAVKQQPITI